MNSLFIWLGIAAAIAATLLIYIVSMKIARNKLSKAFAGAVSSLLVIAGCVAYGVYSEYRRYGAFYDDSWKEPDVAEHFLFENTDTERLQAIYDSDPENFRPELYDVILVRLGCSDCEEQHGRILAAKAEIEAKKGTPAYIVFNRSDIGRIYMDRYGIEGVPSVIVNNAVIPLYPEDTGTAR